MSDTPGIRIPGLDPIAPTEKVGAEWLIPMYNPATDTTYGGKPGNLPFVQSADVSRTIPRLLFAVELADAALKFGRVTYIHSRSGTRPTSDIIVFEAGAKKTGWALEVMPDVVSANGVQLGLVRSVGYNAATDTIAELATNPSVVFQPIAQDVYGIHPPFNTQRELDIWLIQHSAQTFTGPVFNATQQTYTTVGADFSDKCGPGTVGVAITKTSSNGHSTISQYEADKIALADAKAQAYAAIVCPVAAPDPTPIPPQTFNTPLSINNKIADGFSFVPTGVEKLEINTLAASPSGPTISVVFASGGFSCYADYNSEFGGKSFRFTNRAGATFTGTLPTSDSTLNF